MGVVRGVDLVAASAALLAAAMTWVYIRVIHDQGDQPPAWVLGVLIGCAVLATYGHPSQLHDGALRSWLPALACWSWASWRFSRSGCPSWLPERWRSSVVRALFRPVSKSLRRSRLCAPSAVPDGRSAERYLRHVRMVEQEE